MRNTDMLQIQSTHGMGIARRAVIVLVASMAVLGVGLVGLAGWCVASSWVIYHAAYDRGTAVDVRPLRHIIQRALPVGAPLGRARAVLQSRAVAVLLAARGFEPLEVDATFTLVPSFEDSLDESERYPRSWVLFAKAHNRGNGALFSERDLIVRLFLDARGRFTYCTLDERFVMM